MVEIDKERLIDDFVFLMILLGDDFLPELPSLDINEGSIQLVVTLYKYYYLDVIRDRDIISKVHGFLIEDAKPVLPILKILFAKLGEIEAEVFHERQQTENPRRSRFAVRQSSPPVFSLFLSSQNRIPIPKNVFLEDYQSSKRNHIC